jgi:hypothetical protein
MLGPHVKLGGKRRILLRCGQGAASRGKNSQSAIGVFM